MTCCTAVSLDPVIALLGRGLPRRKEKRKGRQKSFRPTTRNTVGGSRCCEMDDGQSGSVVKARERRPRAPLALSNVQKAPSEANPASAITISCKQKPTSVKNPKCPEEAALLISCERTSGGRRRRVQRRI
jgi:hypothetical protein